MGEDILTGFSTRKTEQTVQASKRQSQNNAGGYSFTISDVEQLKRFLTLGSSSGTYYAGAGELTRENAEVVLDMATGGEDSHKVLVDTIVDISQRGAAPKNDYALFALAIAASHGSTEDRQYALKQLASVARTGTHLFLFATYIQQFRGWGRGLRSAVADWYLGKSADRLAYQVVKYRQRNGWTHRDVLRKSHPVTTDPQLSSLFRWITQDVHDGHTPKLVEGFVKAQEAAAKIPELISRYGLTWEMLPSEALNERSTWDALLDKGMPQTALMRQLPRLTRLGMLPEMGGRTSEIADQLSDVDRLVKSRVHPFNVLLAQRTYSGGTSLRGSSVWAPTTQIEDALDAAFYNAFGAVEPANKRTMLALDVSGSMGFSGINGMPITPREASAALSLVQAATEPETYTVGFTGSKNFRRSFSHESGISNLNISPRQRLDDVIDKVSGLPFGPTDCALPMQHALEHKMEVDTFVVYTDSETWSGGQHPHQALREYRDTMGIDAKLIVVGMTATRFTIADPHDGGMLDVAGFDSAVPNLITNFSRGF